MCKNNVFQFFYLNYIFFTVDGFLLLLIGTVMYNQLFDFSWLPCAKEEPTYPEVRNRDSCFVNFQTNKILPLLRKIQGLLSSFFNLWILEQIGPPDRILIFCSLFLSLAIFCYSKLFGMKAYKNNTSSYLEEKQDLENQSK